MSQWVKVPGPAGAPYYESVLTLGIQGAAFDTMKVADLRPVAKPGGSSAALYGFYTGTNAADFVSRIGVKQSSDAGLTWTDVGVHAALIDKGAAGQFDEGGVACPSPVVNGDQSGWWVYHTSLSASGVPSIGMHTVSNDLGTVTRTTAAALPAGGGTYDAAGQSDPCVVANGSSLVLFYAGKDGAGNWSIGVAASTTAAPAAFTGAHQILPPAPGGYDAGGMRHPVAHLLPGGGWRLMYTAIGSDGVHRIAYATAPADRLDVDQAGSRDGRVHRLLRLCRGRSRSQRRRARRRHREELFFTGTDRFGWTRAGKVSATGAGFVASGAATYTLDAGSVRDWRRIVWSPASNPAGTTREVWVSYYPTLSGGWSNPYEVTSNSDLPFLLTVQKMRWQVRMTSSVTSATPTVDQLTVNHAPVQFPMTATAVTTPLGPPDGLYLLTLGRALRVVRRPDGHPPDGGRAR